MVVISVSDRFGKELFTGPYHEFEIMSMIENYEEDPDQCYISAYSVKQTLWEKREETGYYQAHPTHWLNEFGVEVDAGDYI